MDLLISLHICLSWQFVWDYPTVCFCFPIERSLGPDPSPGLKVWESKTFLDDQDFCCYYIGYFYKKSFWAQQDWRGTKNLGGIALECPPWLQVWFRFSDTFLNRHYLTKQSSLYKQRLTAVSCPDLFAGIHLLTAHANTCERMLCHRVDYGDNYGVVCILRTTWSSQKAAHPKEEYREFALMNQRQSSKFGFWTLAKLQNSSVDF